jgi:hypothetical protein
LYRFQLGINLKDEMNLEAFCVGCTYHSTAGQLSLAWLHRRRPLALF